MQSVIRISRSALAHNVRAFRRILPKETQLMAVVKGNAYGHGMELCARVFAQAGAQWFGVAGVQEALVLQHLVSKPILVLSYLDGETADLEKAIRVNIRFPAYSLAMLHMYERLGKKVKQAVRVHVKLDTGTTRVGFLPKELPQLIQTLRRLPHVHVEGVYSHFAEVETRDQNFSQLQHERFTTLASTLESGVGECLIKHMNCSAGTLVHPDADLNMVRIGMSLYGVWTVADPTRVHKRYPGFRLRPALRWDTQLVQVKAVNAGTSVGYNRTYRFIRPGRIGVIPVGYWDGFDRSLSNRGVVHIGQHRAPIRGRICMNLSMVDVSNVPGARTGTRVSLIGPDVPAELMAQQSGTIVYEVLTRLHPQIPRSLTR